MDESRSWPRRAWEGYLFALRLVCASLLVWTVGVTLINVAMRYLVSQAIVWADESARLAFVVFTFLAAALAAASRSHLTIDSLTQRLAEPGQRVVAVLIALCTTAFCVILLVGGIQVAAANIGQASPALRIPLGWVYASLPLSAVLILISTAGAALFGPAQEGGPGDAGADRDLEDVV